MIHENSSMVEIYSNSYMQAIELRTNAHIFEFGEHQSKKKDFLLQFY